MPINFPANPSSGQNSSQNGRNYQYDGYAWNLIGDSVGNFTSLSVSGIPVSISGHLHTTSDITNFNSTVSGILPVKDIIPGSGISIVATSGIYNIAVDNSNLVANTGNFDVVSFNPNNESVLTKGQISWDDTEGTMDIGLTDNTTIHIGEHRFFRVRNETGDTLYKGQPVYATGVHNNGIITPSKYIADGTIREVRFIGLMLEDLSNNNNGYAIDFGHLEEMDLDGSATNFAVGDETWVAGDILYVHPTGAGKLTNVEPKHSISVAIVLDPGNGNGNGRMFVRPTSYGHLDDNHDVSVSGATNGQFLQYNSVTDYWVPSSSGNFTSLSVNGTGVSLSGHTHITSQITDFNSAVSGLLPVKNILPGSNITISSVSGEYTINSTASVSAEDVMDIIGTGIIGGTGISVNYDDINNNLSINLYASAIKGYEELVETKDTFSVSGGYLVGNLQVYYNGLKLISGEDYTATDGSSFVLAQSGVQGDVVEWAGLGGPIDYLVGEGSVNKVSKWSQSGTLINSNIYDDGTNVGIGTTSPSHNLHVSGSGYMNWIQLQENYYINYPIPFLSVGNSNTDVVVLFAQNGVASVFRGYIDSNSTATSNTYTRNFSRIFIHYRTSSTVDTVPQVTVNGVYNGGASQLSSNDNGKVVKVSYNGIEYWGLIIQDLSSFTNPGPLIFNGYASSLTDLSYGYRDGFTTVTDITPNATAGRSISLFRHQNVSVPDGNVGIGTNQPAYALDVAAGTGIFRDQLLLKNSNLPTSPGISFNGDEDTGIYSGSAGAIRFSSNGSRRFAITSNSLNFSEAGTSSAPAFTINDDTDTGIFAPATNNWGVATNAIERLRIDSNGNVRINGANAATSAVGAIHIKNGTAPSSNITDGVILYAEDSSSSSELKVRDEAGNITTLSPHNFSLIPDGPSESMAWAFYSEKDGKKINVDMLKVIRLLEKLTGEKLVYEN